MLVLDSGAEVTAKVSISGRMHTLQLAHEQEPRRSDGRRAGRTRHVRMICHRGGLARRKCLMAGRRCETDSGRYTSAIRVHASCTREELVESVDPS